MRGVLELYSLRCGARAIDRILVEQSKFSQTTRSLGVAEEELQARAREIAEMQEQLRSIKAEHSQRFSEQRSSLPCASFHSP